MMIDSASQMYLDLGIGNVICLLINLCQQQQMNKQLKSFKSNMSQKVIHLEDESEVGRGDHLKMQQLLKQNQMKDIALKKANNLIELLNIELQVQRNSHQENMKLAQEQIRGKYQRENSQLRDKISFLQREIKAKIHTNQNDKTIRKSVLTRANSSRSVENVKKRAVHQKYTETFEEMPSVVKQPINFQAEIYKKQAIQLQEWRQEIMKLLNNLIKQEYDELEDIVGQLENMGEDYDKLITFKPKNKRKIFEELQSIVQSQTTIINSLKAYCQSLEDMCKNIIFKLNSIFGKSHPQYPSVLSIQQQVKMLGRRLLDKRQEWRDQRAAIESENNELKYILDSMIKLVRQQKKHK